MIFSFNRLKQIFSGKLKPEAKNPSLGGEALGSYENIFAARVLEVKKHSNADRLRVAKLDIGDKIIEPVVCGAFNFDAGAMVALALPGAKIAQNIHSEDHQPFILQKAKIRGVESQGMICAAFELGLGPLSDKPEIMLLKQAVKPGSQFSPGMVQ